MRIAVLSDVHGNRFALEAVLAEIHAFGPDEVLNLGDTVWGGADPKGAWELQQEFLSRTLRGNNDERVAGMVENTPKAAQYRDWVLGQVGQDAAGTLRKLPLTLTAADGEVLLCHGTPQTPWLGLAQLHEDDAFREATNEELLQRVEGFLPQVVVAGHLHTEKLRGIQGIAFVNSGPVSYQNDGIPAARWTLLERRKGTWSIAFRRVPYDWEAAARWAEEHAMNSESEARQLRTGRGK